MANITGRQTVDERSILEVDADPSLGAGTLSDIGTVAIVKNGDFYIKIGSGDTQWARLLDAFRQVYTTQTQATTLNGVLSLVANSASVQFFTGTATGYIIRLPDATLNRLGTNFTFVNTSTQSIALQNFSSTLLLTVDSLSVAEVILQTNTTSAGAWQFTCVPIGNFAVKNAAGAKGDVQFRAATVGTFAADTSGYFNYNDTTQSLTIGPPGTNLSNNPCSVNGNVNSYVQSNVQNISGGASASSDIVATADTGNDNTKYIDFGINSSNYNDLSYTINGALDGYFYCSGGGIAIGTDSVKPIQFFSGGTLLANEKMRISSGGNILIGTQADNALDLIQVPPSATTNIKSAEIYDDCLWGNLGNSVNPYDVVGISGNGGSVVVEGAAISNDYFGKVSAITGTISNSTAFAVIDYFNSVNKIRLRGKRIICEMRVQVPTLSTNPTSYTTYVGLADGNTASLPTNGIFFTYTNGMGGGAWIATNRSSATSTTLSSGVNVSAGTWYKLRFEVNAAGTSVSFYVNDVSIGSISTNIPLATVGLRPMVQIAKGNPASATSRQIDLDYLYLKFFP